ncbi:MAG: hypothetical protein KJP00_13055 [Bacteroidia bacterium]|nr:hypothetical protein [Bacteroidia bacterium]
MSSSRQLTVILLSDISGSTSVLQKNQRSASLAIRKHEKMLKRLVPRFQGQIQHFQGETSICIFSAHHKAVDCARAMQMELQDQVQLRIGIHDGEVIECNGETYMNGVDLAYQIEMCGHPGTILFSKNVHNAICNETSHSDVSLGYFKCANSTKPLEIYGLTDPGLKSIRPLELKNRLSYKVPSQVKYPKYQASIHSY